MFPSPFPLLNAFQVDFVGLLHQAGTHNHPKMPGGPIPTPSRSLAFVSVTAAYGAIRTQAQMAPQRDGVVNVGSLGAGIGYIVNDSVEDEHVEETHKCLITSLRSIISFPPSRSSHGPVARTAWSARCGACMAKSTSAEPILTAAATSIVCIRRRVCPTIKLRPRHRTPEYSKQLRAQAPWSVLPAPLRQWSESPVSELHPLACAGYDRAHLQVLRK